MMRGRHNPDDPRNPDNLNPYHPIRTEAGEGMGAVPILAIAALMFILGVFFIGRSLSTPMTERPIAEQTARSAPAPIATTSSTAAQK